MVPERRAPSIILAKRAPAVKPLTVRNQSFKRVLPEIHSDYATPYAVSSPITSYLEKSNSLVYPGSYFSRVSVTAAVEKPATMEETEEEFLTELDAQIAELQVSTKLNEKHEVEWNENERKEAFWLGLSLVELKVIVLLANFYE